MTNTTTPAIPVGESIKPSQKFINYILRTSFNTKLSPEENYRNIIAKTWDSIYNATSKKHKPIKDIVVQERIHSIDLIERIEEMTSFAFNTVRKLNPAHIPPELKWTQRTSKIVLVGVYRKDERTYSGEADISRDIAQAITTITSSDLIKFAYVDYQGQFSPVYTIEVKYLTGDPRLVSQMIRSEARKFAEAQVDGLVAAHKIEREKATQQIAALTLQLQQTIKPPKEIKPSSKITKKQKLKNREEYLNRRTTYTEKVNS
jgi:hypothetical protein